MAWTAPKVQAMLLRLPKLNPSQNTPTPTRTTYTGTRTLADQERTSYGKP